MSVSFRPRLLAVSLIFTIAMLGIFNVRALAQIQTVTDVYDFGNPSIPSDGAQPFSGLMQSTNDGNLYGTTYGGGGGYGTIYRITPSTSSNLSDTYTSIYAFTNTPDGANPFGPLIQASDGNFYGTTELGGSGVDGGGPVADGTVYELTWPALTENVKYSFNGYNTTTGDSGAYPVGGLAEYPSGTLVGTTPDYTNYAGNSFPNDPTPKPFGTLFSIRNFATAPQVQINAFTGAGGTTMPGAVPLSDLVVFNDELYGTTWAGGSIGDGEIFTLNPDGAFSDLFDNLNDSNGDLPLGSEPSAAPYVDPFGVITVPLEGGGSDDGGSVAQIQYNYSANQYQVNWELDFDQTNGSTPYGPLLLASDGNFYGMCSSGGANGGGSIYQIANPTTANPTLNDLWDFNFSDGPNVGGSHPYGALLLASNGYIYGTTSNGAANAAGNVIKFSLQPNITTLSPPDAAQGDPAFTLTVNGSNFNVNSVIHWAPPDANGFGLATTYVSPTQLTANIPASFVANQGTAAVTVVNADGGQSANVAFPINPPRPQITSISPTDVADDATNVTITITPAAGTTFVTGEKVSVGNHSYTNTTLDGSGNLLVTLLSSQTRGDGVLPVAAVDSYGDASNSINLTIDAPALTSLVPNHATQNGPGENVVVNGNWFVSSDWLAWPSIDGDLYPLASPALTETSFTVTVPPSFLGTAGPITVYAAASGTDGPDFSNPLTFTVDPPPTLTSISPTSVAAGANNLTLTLTGTNFVSGDNVSVGGNLVTPTIVSTTSMTAAVPAADIATAGSVPVEVVTVDGIATAAHTLTVTAPAITSLSPPSATAGAPGIQLMIAGTNFVAGENVSFGSDTLTPTSQTTTQIVVSVPPTDLTTPGSVNVSLLPAVGGGSGSNTVTFNVTNAPTLTSLSPNNVAATTPGINLTLTGTNFVSGDFVNFGYQFQLTPTSLTTTSMVVSVPYNALTVAGPVSVNVQTVDGVTTASQTFNVNPPNITSLSPTSATAGAPGIVLTITGTNFVNDVNVAFGSDRIAPSSVTSTQVVVSIPASDLTTPGQVNVYLQSNVDGGPNSNTVTFNVTNAPTLTSISPTDRPAGGPQFNLTLTGTNFVAGDIVNFGSYQITPPSASVTPTSIQATIPAAEIENAGSVSVSVQTVDGVVTGTQTLTIHNPTITGISPSSRTAGASGFSLTITGTYFTSGWNVIFGAYTLTPTSVTATQMVVAIPSAAITTAGSVNVKLLPQNTDLPGTSNTVIFTVTNAPTTTSLSPSSVPAGAATFNLTITGTNFVSGDVVNFGAAQLTPTSVTGTTIVVSVPQSDVITAGELQVSILTADGVTSNSTPFTVVAPYISAFSPQYATAGAPGIVLTITGTSFAAGEQVSFGGTLLTPTSLTATQIVVSVPAAQLTTVASIPVFLTPAVSGGTGSNTLNFDTITAPTVSGLSPSSVAAGSPTFYLSVDGNYFASGYVVNVGSHQLIPTSVATTVLIVSVPQSYVTTAGPISVTVQTPDGYVTPSQTLNVVAPNITGLAPVSATAGAPGITLTVTGTNFVTGEDVNFGGTILTPTSVTATQIVVSVPAAQLTTVGAVNVSITPAVAGGSGSNTVVFNVTNAPALTSLSPASTSAGAPTFNLTLTGTNFVASDIVNFGALQMTPTSVTANAIIVSVPQTDVATAGPIAVNVKTADNVTTASQTLTVNAPSITSLSPVSATAGAPGITLTVTGTNFVSGEEVKVGSTTLTPTSLNATTIVVTVSAAQLTTVGPVNVSITPAVAGGSGSNTIVFNVTNTPTLTSISPSTIAAGTPTFNLTLTGTNFVANDIVNFGALQLTPTSVTTNTIVVSVPQTDIATAGPIGVNVKTVDNVTTASQTLTVNAPSITSVSPVSATAGAPGITLTVTGTWFTTGEKVDFGGTILTPTSLNATTIVVTVPAAQLTTVGPVNVSITPAVAGGSGSSATTFTVTNAPTLTSISPAAVSAGAVTFNLTLTGTNFVSGDYVNFGALQLTPTSVTATTILVSVPQADIATAGSTSVNVETVDGVTTASQTLTVNAPTIATLSPASATAGAPGVILTITGTNFVTGEEVKFGSTTLAPTSFSATQIVVSVPAAQLTTVGPVSVSITPAVAGGSGSNTVVFNVTNAPTLTSISPAAVSAGAVTFNLTLTGTNFVSGDYVNFGALQLTPTSVTATTIAVSVPQADVATAGSISVNVATVDGVTTASQTLTVNAPTITTISPASATAGAAGITLTITGTNFVSGEQVNFGGMTLAPTSLSATQIVVSVPAAQLTTAGTENVSITPAVAGGTGSSSDTFNVTNAPTLTGISPNNVAAGGPAFSLTLTGTNFVAGDVVNVGPAQLAPVSLTPTTIVVNLPQIPIAAVANVNVQTVDGVTSASQTLTVNAPNISGLVPGTATAGSTGMLLTINGTWFTAGEQVSFGGTVLTPSTLTATQITVTVPAAQLTTAGPISVFVTPAVVGGTGSNTATFTVTSAPTLTSLTPNNANSGGPGFNLVVVGSNFVAGDVIDWNGSPLNTTFVSAVELDAAVPTTDIATSGIATVTAVTIDGSVSNGLLFTINFINPRGNAPTITSISPTSVTAGAAGFTLTVNGTNFAIGDTVQWNGTALVTTFVSAIQLTAAVPTADVAVAGAQNVTVVDLLGDTSNVEQFTVNALNAYQPGLQMISAPYDYSGDDIDQVLGYSNVLFAVWEPTLASYVMTPISPADTLHQGQAAWVDIPAQGAGVQYRGTDLTTETGSMTISLPGGWSMIGNPFGQPLSLTSAAQLGIKAADGSLMTLAQANQQGLVYATLYSYDTASNTYVNHATDSLQAYQGYWLLAFEPCTMVMTSPDGNNPH